MTELGKLTWAKIASNLVLSRQALRGASLARRSATLASHPVTPDGRCSLIHRARSGSATNQCEGGVQKYAHHRHWPALTRTMAIIMCRVAALLLRNLAEKDTPPRAGGHRAGSSFDWQIPNRRTSP